MLFRSVDVNSVAIQGNTVVSGSGDWTVRIWDLEDLKAKPIVLEGHSDWVTNLAIQGNTVVSGSNDKTVRIWDLEDPKAEPVVLYFENFVRCLSIVKNILSVGSGNDVHFLQLWS